MPATRPGGNDRPFEHSDLPAWISIGEAVFLTRRSEADIRRSAVEGLLGSTSIGSSAVLVRTADLRRAGWLGGASEEAFSYAEESDPSERASWRLAAAARAVALAGIVLAASFALGIAPGAPVALQLIGSSHSPGSKPTSCNPNSKKCLSLSPSPSPSPAASPSLSPTQSPSLSPTQSPSLSPTQSPSLSPTQSPSLSPTQSPSPSPSLVGPAPALGCSGVPVTPATGIQPAIDRYPSGTTFCIAAGVYRIQSAIVPKSNDALIGAPGAVINGAKLLTGFTRDGSFWVVGGQTQQAPVYNAVCLPATYTGCLYPEGVFYDDASLRQVTSLADLRPGSFYFDYANDKIYIADDPSGHTVEASVAPEAIRGDATYQANVTIQGLLVEKFANWPTDRVAAVDTGNGWTVADNEVRFNDGIGIKADTGSVVRSNFVHDNGRIGVSTSFSDNVLIEGNEIAGNDSNQFSFWNAGATKIWDSSNITLRNNDVHDNTGHGLRSDTDCVNILIEGNTVVRNTGVGILHEIGYDAVIRNNDVEGNNTSAAGSSPWYGGQIEDYDSPGVEIYGNTVVAPAGTHGIVLRDDDRGSGTLGTYEIRDVQVTSNTVRLKSGGFSGLAGNRALSVYDGRNISFDQNEYIVPTSDGTFWYWGTGLTAPERWRDWQGYGRDLRGMELVA
jgi:parallel beta-helix repeat protein